METIKWKYNVSLWQLLTLLTGFCLVITFALFAAALGGEALSGKSENGHYYIRGGRLFHEVSHAKYLLSGLTCFGASLGAFLIAHVVLGQIKKAGIIDGKNALATVLEIFFGLVCGYIGVYALIIVLRV